MATDQVRIQSLYAELYRTIIRFGLLTAAAWLFAAFSYYFSKKTGTDWFSRSGSVMALAGAAIAFRLVNFYQHALAAALREGLVSVAREIELGLEPPQIVSGALVPGLSDRHRRYCDLGLRRPADPSDLGLRFVVHHGISRPPMSGLGLVSRVTPVHTAMRNCTRDEGRSFEFGNQVLISSHRKLLWSKATVVNVAEKSEQDFDRYD